jgi:tetratricopeptide (TPR) repeat protein
LIVAAVCAVLAVPVLGAEGDKAVAKAHYEAATRLYDIKEWAKALDEYKAAYLAKPDPAFLFNIGQCYRKLGRLDQALDFYQEYLKKAPPDDPNRANVEARIRNTDTSDMFEGEAPPKPAAQPVQPPPSPPQVPPVPEPVTPEPAGTPPPAVDSPVPVGQPTAVPLFPTAAQPAAVQPAGVDLAAVEPAGQANTPAAFYKTWWFWTGVGAVVVAGTVAAIIIAKSGGGGVSASTALGTQTVFQ